MPPYHFALRNDVNANENLGYIELANDDEALEFGRETVRLITLDHLAQYSGSVMEITEGNRTVGNISLECAESFVQKKYG
jgi:hypothetical protein